jgi:hypothetical protein
MWSNLAIVVTDAGELASAARMLGRVIERAAQDSVDGLDLAILD